MAENDQRNLFNRLTSLFRSGPVVKRRIKADRFTRSRSSALDFFKKSQSHIYSNAINAYGQYDRMARYADFSEMEYCVSGDTLIATPSGYERIEDLAEKYGLDKEFIVYAYDHNKGQIVPALGKQARQTRTDEAFRVKFDSGKEIIGTGNHRLMLRDGTYRRIDELQAGDSMMPFYRRDFYGEEKSKDSGDGYRWVYTANPGIGRNGWIAEHKLIAEWASGREMRDTEVVHHKNFIKNDNSPENLEIMERTDHSRLHQVLMNGKKWSPDNQEWIAEFKRNHSTWMRENNPATRKDITFGRILEICERDGFNLYSICQILDTDPNVIKRRLRDNGFLNFETFAKAYHPDWKNNGWDNKGPKNPRYDSSLTFQRICDEFKDDMSAKLLSQKLGTTQAKLTKRIKLEGYKSYSDFRDNYGNHKVVSIEPFGTIPLYDLTVDGYKNFATDSVISHNTPEIASALDIYSHESTAQDDKGRVLHIYSDNAKVDGILEELFYDTLNIEFNLPPWIRNLCKFGDFFLFNDVSPDHGIVNVFPIPVNEIEREEGYDPEDPLAVRFRWVTQGNRILENWQISHFRLLGNDAFLPYGSSILEPARRIWRQLILIEDAMLVYRIVRSPERRIFYIDTGNIPADDIPTYMEQAKSVLRSNQVVDRNSGRVDKRYNPLSVDEDYFIPMRGGEPTSKIETLAGGQYTGDIDDVQYIQNKLFAALKIPKPYLGYDENLSSKATLAQEDIRFSRTVNNLQRVILSELNKIAIIHLFSHGFDDEDLLNFELRLSNPSTIAQQQKLEIYRTKFEIAAQAPEGMLSRDYIRKNILGLTKEEIEIIEDGKEADKARDLEIEAITLPEEEEGPTPEEALGLGGEEAEAPEGGEEAPDEEGGLFAGDERDGDLLMGFDDDDLIEEDDDDDVRPIKPSARVKRNRKRKRHSDAFPSRILTNKGGEGGLDLKAMTADSSDPFGGVASLGRENPFKAEGTDRGEMTLDGFFERKIKEQARMDSRTRSILKRFKESIPIEEDSPGILTESEDSEKDLAGEIDDE